MWEGKEEMREKEMRELLGVSSLEVLIPYVKAPLSELSPLKCLTS